MKPLKRIVILFLAVAVMLLCHAPVYATNLLEQTAGASIIMTDETGGYNGGIIEVAFCDSDSGDVIVTVELTKNNSWGYSRGVMISLPKQYTYNISFNGVDAGYKIVNTFDRADAETTFTVNDVSNSFYWSIVASKQEQEQVQSTEKSNESEITSTNKDNIKVDNEEAERVYQKFLDAVSFIETDETWCTGFAATLNQYGENSINRNTYSKWYADYVQNGSAEEYFAMTSFEQFLWTETYTRLAGAVNSSWGYSHYFADETSFKAKVTDIVTNTLNGNNSDVVKEAYLELMDWQYNYITENGVPFNFIRNRSYIEEVGRVPVQGENPNLTEKEEIQDVIDELDPEELDEIKQEGKDDGEKSVWSDTMSVLAENAVTILILVILLVGVGVVIYIRKSKNIDGDK